MIYVKKMEKIVSLFLIISLISFSSQNLIVVNLDSGEESEDKNLVSNYLKNPPYDMNPTFYEHYSSAKMYETISMSKKKNIEMRLGDEAFNSVIDTVSFYNKNGDLKTFVKTNIDSSIIPNNYYISRVNSNFDSSLSYNYGTTEPSNISNYDLTCTYNNNKPTFDYSSFSFNYKNIVSGARINFGLDSNGYLKVFTFNKNKKVSESEIPSTNKAYGVPFSKLIFSDPYFTDDQMLFAITGTNEIYILLVVDSVYKISIDFQTIINVQNNQNITQISYNNEYYFISTNEELRWYNRNNSETYTSIAGNFLDILVNSRSVYAITSNGLIIYDTLNMENFGQPYPYNLTHPYLSRFDYVLYDNTNRESSYFVGIVVDNHPNQNINEILIEFYASKDFELTPKYNHVFVTQKDISVDNIVTDKYSYFTYIFDSQKIYMLSRSVPVFQIGYSYLLSISSSTASSISIIARSDYVAGIENSANYFRDILVDEGSSYKLLSNLNRTNPNLICTVKKSGLLYEFLSLRQDCSGYDSDNKWKYRVCFDNRYYSFNVDPTSNKIKRAGIWIGVGFAIAIIFGIIIFIICKVFGRKPTKVLGTNNFYTNGNNNIKNNNDNNKVEVVGMDEKYKN